MDLDNRLTRYERSVVRGELANIIGVYLSATDDMPTLAEVDANGVGSLYTLRQQAREIGVPITDADYVKLGDAYTALRTYLSGLSIKPWILTLQKHSILTAMSGMQHGMVTITQLTF